MEKIYKIIAKIPRGKVTTYGQIARIIQNSKFKVQNDNPKLKITPRMVGMALHKNPDPENIPCHRVVDRNGRVAQNFAFSSQGRRASGPGGWMEQRRRLVFEGVRFKDKRHVDLASSIWQGSSKPKILNSK